MRRGLFGVPFGHPFERGNALAGRRVRLAQAPYPTPPEISVEEYVQKRDQLVQAWEDSGRSCLISMRYITVDPNGEKRFMQACRFPDGSSAGTSAPVQESSLATKPCDEAWAWKCQNEEAAMGNPGCPGEDPGPVLCSAPEAAPELPCVTPPTTGNPACPAGQIEAYEGTGECYAPCICVEEGGATYATWDAESGIKKRSGVTGMWLRDQGVDVDPATPYCPGAEGPAPEPEPQQTTTPTAGPPPPVPTSVPSGPPGAAPKATTLTPPAAGFQTPCNPGRPGISGRFHRDFFGRSMF